MTTITLSPNGESASQSAEGADVLLVGTVRGVVRLERDPNGRWNEATRGLGSHQIGGLFFDEDSGTLVAGAYSPGGIFVSRDGGASWSEDRLGEGIGVFSLTAQPGEGLPAIFAGTEPVRLYRSDDLGETWTELPAIRSSETDFWIFPTPPRLSHLKHVISHESNPERLYASIEQGALLVSNDGGESWTEVESFLTPEDRFHSDIHRVVISPSNPDRLFMPTGEGFYRSSDAGESWEHVRGSVDRIRYPDPCFVHPRQPETLFLGGAGLFPGAWSEGPEGSADPAVLRSDDEGATWREVTDGLPRPMRGNIEAMSFHDTGTGVSLFVGTTQGEIYGSDDAGERWSLVAEGLPPISKSHHYRKFLSPEARAEVEALMAARMSPVAH